MIKVMVDGGKGFSKICMMLLPENYAFELDCGVDNSYLENIQNFM